MPDAPIPARLYHGSATPFEPGFVLTPRGEEYEENWGGTDFYAALERWRPDGATAHRDAVFLVGDPDDVDLAGGSTDWCLEVEPTGPVTRHDINWGSEISCLRGDGKGIEDPEVRRAALAYWAGEAHPNESVWEYLAPGARVLSCEPWETFGMAP